MTFGAGKLIDKDNWRRRDFNEALVKAELREIRIHDLRHTSAILRISKGDDVADVSNQLYAAYAEGCDLRDLVAIVGEDALSDRDQRFLQFADAFEKQFIRQGSHEDRSIEQTLTIAWELLSMLPTSELKKIDEKLIKKYLPKKKEAET